MILPRTSEGLYLLQRVRDEAHRFAITHHRSRRSKTMVESLLDDVPGLGEVRRKTLLKHFGSLRKAPGRDRRGDRRGARHRAAHRRGDRRAGALAGPRRRQRQHRDRRDRGNGPDAASSPARPVRRRPAEAPRGRGGHRDDRRRPQHGGQGARGPRLLRGRQPPPPQLVADVVRLVDETRGPMQPVAVVVDVRSGSFFDRAPGGARPGAPAGAPPCCSSRPPTTCWSAARRRPAAAPAAGRRPAARRACRERTWLADLRGDADLVIDTTQPQRAPARPDKVAEAFGTPETTSLKTTVVSFGFKYGIPVDADLVADMRFLPNPHWVPELRPLTGRDRGAPTTSRAGPRPRSSSTGTSHCSRPSAPATCARASGS